ncbi:Cell wall assembly regulator [Vermiconidia calcicola]|uniref:Cell wall assembly regulator n=1 Tax=Vermiconidia calcicola TaxID=1690605 RepID=A0ACC3NIB2_9PEZI|nr:Cell wall assembly regulator [Vermiconidia calcicola]
MSFNIAAQFRALWHDLTSNDRHASADSPYRTGLHQPLAQNRHTSLATITTSALDSRTDLDSPYREDLEAGHGFAGNNSRPNSPYAQGLRKTLQRQGSGMDGKDMTAVGNGEIQMQSFSDGLPPPPPVVHSWKRIDRWMEDNYEELWENLGEGATINDVNELEHEMDCTLPQEVRESLQIHDGQERGGMPTGIVFGCMLLDCEEIMQEWRQWRTINEVYFGDNRSYEIPQAPLKAFAGSSSAAVPLAQAQQSGNPQWRSELQDKQDSQPPGAIQKAYAHPAWVPLARDWGGNNICVDLAPGPTGRWGQIILTGRDYDCKYVISRSWAAFLATLADDMNTDKWFIDEDSKELKLREFKQQSVEPAYIDILRWRADQKYGRKNPKKRPLRINSQVAGGQANGYSPYGSPTSGPEDRGRSPHRINGNGKAPATSSPRAHMGSPLARVTEETPQPLRLDTHVDTTLPRPEKLVSVDTPRSHNAAKLEKLVPIDTPVIGSMEDRRGSLPRSKLNHSMLSSTEEAVVNDTPTTKAEEAAAKAGAEEEMKDVQI